ncbi:MAG: protein-ADP-ribose hydrolase [Lachnospiraceae bacterium]|nr:protein-ADP-ribose hydrolase [Lachnospiraceae bacterium]
MTKNREQEKRLDYLLKKLKEDSVQYKDLEVGDSYEDKRMALRSLMNIRMPRHMADDVLKVQDDFLMEEAKEKGIVTLAEIPAVRKQYGSKGPYADKLSVWQGDITRLSVDAIVNAANSQMLGCFVPCHRCIDNAIHSAAGIRLRKECADYMNRKKMQVGPNYVEPVGQAVLTKGYNLPAKYIIHTVGPIVRYQLTDALRKGLENCYQSILQCCMENGIRTVAFCCISTGEFHFPNDEAAKIAVKTVTQFLSEHEQKFDRIIFNVFKEEDREIYERIMKTQL